MSVNQEILVDDLTTYFSIDESGNLTPTPYINRIEDNLFALDLLTGDLSPSNVGVEDEFFEIVNGDITPKVL
jgi:hypothetical protein